MIHVYDIGNEAYEKNGDVILEPIQGKVRMIAGGNYDLTLVQAMDAEGKWTHLAEEAVIKAPVPKETISNAFVGLEADVYVTTEEAALRSGPSEPTTKNYPTWSISAEYSVGAKVSWNNKNYQCNYYDETSPYAHIAPSSCSWWVEIARIMPGDPALVNTKSGTELYYVSGPEDGWYLMSTTYGLEGYIKSTQVQYSRHMEPGEIKPRVITDQLFRIKTVQTNDENQTVTVTARHVSYDLNGVLIDKVKIVRKAPAAALAIMQQSFMREYRGTIATDMIQFEDADYSGEISGKSGMYALLDPDKGIVPAFDAEFRRDNWDLFVMAKTETDRGFRIRYRNNMKGINWNGSTENLVTCVVPVAKDENGEDLYLDPVRWVDSEYVNAWPTVYMERLKVNGQVGKDDGTETDTKWTIQTLRAEMEKQARSRFDVDQADRGVDEITVDFIMLGDTAEHGWLKDLQSVLLYDKVIAINERTGISASMTVSEIDFDIVKERITGAKVVNVKAYNGRNVSGFNVLNNSITGDKLTDEAGEELMSSAVDEAVEQSAEYTRDRMNSALNSAKEYADEQAADAISTAASNTSSSISSYDSQIKRFLRENYQPL